MVLLLRFPCIKAIFDFLVIITLQCIAFPFLPRSGCEPLAKPGSHISTRVSIACPVLVRAHAFMLSRIGLAAKQSIMHFLITPRGAVRTHMQEIGRAGLAAFMNTQSQAGRGAASKQKGHQGK